MATYPELIPRPLGILTNTGWITGTMGVPKMHTLADYLESGRDFLKLTDVKLPHVDLKLPFLALQRRAAILVVPLDHQPRQDSSASSLTTSERDVVCLFDDCMLSGKVDVLASARLSDFLMHRAGFIAVRNGTLRGAAYLPPEARVPFDLAFVNRERIVGVSDTKEDEAVREFPMAQRRGRMQAATPRYHDV